MTVPSDRFKLMSDRIIHNTAGPAAGVFGGAAVIIPPEGGGDPIEILIDDMKGDPAQFYSTLLTRINITLEELKDTMRQGAFRGR